MPSLVPCHSVQVLNPRPIVATVFAAVILFPSLVGAYETEIKSASREIADRIQAANKQRVAVMDFTDLQGSVTEFGRFLAEEFSVVLAQEAKHLEVIERTQLKVLLLEHRLSATGIIDPQTARKLGQIAGVEVLVTGTVTPFGDSVRLSVKAIDSQTARTVGASSANIPRTKAVDDLMARGVASGTPANGNSSGSSSAKATRQNVPPELARAVANDFLFAITKCSRIGDRVECTGSVANLLARTRDIQWSRGSYLVDNLGNQYRLSGLGLPSFTPSAMGASIEPEVPVHFSFIADGVSREARTITVMLEIVGWSPTSWRRRVALRNVPLSD